MMRRTILITLLAAALTARAQTPTLDSLYHAIDEAIEQADGYLSAKQQTLEELHCRAAMASTMQSRYEAEVKLYEQYRAFKNDSAIRVLNRCIALADSMRRTDLKAESYLRMALQLSTSGFYTEALGYLQNIPKEEMHGQTQLDYFRGMNHLYGEMASYTTDEHMQPLYFKQSERYRDSLLAHLPHDSEQWLSLKEAEEFSLHHYDEAMALNDSRLQLANPGTHQYAIVAFFRSLDYQGKGDVEQQKLWLGQSALCDIKNVVMDQASLWMLADLLSREGQLERAYRYVEFSWQCTSRFSTHVRSWLVSPVLTMINDSYKQRVRSYNTRLTVAILLLSLMALVLLGLYLYVSRKRRQLAEARERLAAANAQLSEANTKLTTLNEQLSRVNVELSDSNRVKDEYLGRFLSLCSGYIDKLDQMRQKVVRRMKAKQLDDLFRQMQDDSMKAQEVSELLAQFDASFLRLFPHFIEDFNALLKPEHRIQTAENGSLPTDMRIFALIRLGIDDSSRIAEFLHYSPNTIYNYRARLKSKALCDRDEFEERVKRIGQ